MAEITREQQEALALTDVKTYLDVKDNIQDGLLKLIIKNVAIQLSNRLEGKPEIIPANLTYIITEVAIVRFNRIGSEGLKQNQEESHTLVFYDPQEDFKPYQEDIGRYNAEQNPLQGKGSKGQVLFF